MIDNEAIQEMLEAEQEPKTVELLAAALLAGLLVEVNQIYQKYCTEDGLNMSKGKRKKAFFKRLQELVAAHYVQVEQAVVSTAEAGYVNSYERHMASYEKELDLPLGKMAITSVILTTAFQEGYPINKSMNYNRQKTIQQLQKEFTKSFRAAEPMEVAVKRVETVIEKDKERVKTVVREETARMQSQAQVQSVADAEEQGVGVDITWNSMRDKQVRFYHVELNGQQADEEGWFYVPDLGDKAKHPHGFRSISLNIRCRCYLEARGVNVKDNALWKELNSIESASVRRAVWEERKRKSKKWRDDEDQNLTIRQVNVRR